MTLPSTPEVPADLVQPEDGWIDPVRMAAHVRDALARSVGAVRKAGEGSLALLVWDDRDEAGRKVRRAGGEWLTGFVRTPAEVLACLKQTGVADASNYRQRALRVRYETVRRSGVAKPGRIDLQIDVIVRRAAGATEMLVKPPREEGCLVSDFLDEF